MTPPPDRLEEAHLRFPVVNRRTASAERCAVIPCASRRLNANTRKQRNCGLPSIDASGGARSLPRSSEFNDRERASRVPHDLAFAAADLLDSLKAAGRDSFGRLVPMAGSRHRGARARRFDRNKPAGDEGRKAL